jgi:general secretion pathway protein D
MGLAACGAIVSEQNPPGTPDVFDKVRNIDLLPRFARPSAAEPRTPDGLRPATYFGAEGQPVREVAPGAHPDPNGGGFELNFENAPVTTVAKVILGDILEAGYTIDPRVQGTVTLASGRAVPKSDLLYVLENALRLSNVALVRDPRGYRLIPISEAAGSGSVDVAGRGGPEAGFGTTVIPLQYISAPMLLKLLDSFAVKPGMVRADNGRNILVVVGASTERRAIAETVLSFDADWMRGQSVGIYPVHNSTPEPVISELEKIMDTGEGGLSQNLVKLQAIGRLNSILVVASKPNLLRTTATWIARLDQTDTTMTGVRVYRVRYGEARQLAGLLNDIFAGRGAGAVDSAANQIAPSSGAVVQSSVDRSVPNQPGLRIAGARNQPGATDSARPSGLAPDSGPAVTSAPRATGTSTGQGVLPGVRITADVVNNTLLIYANQESYRIIERTLNQLDRPQLQVSIEATIAEISLNENLAYGVQFFLKSADIGLGRDKGSLVFTPSTAASGSLIGRVLPGFNFLIGSEAEPRLILDALRGVTEVKVLSTPSLVVLDNQVATLQVGDQVPVTTGTATVLTGTTPVVNSIDYRNTGVILRVVPRINFNGNVMLDVEQEISNVGANADTLTPTVSQRKVKSSIVVASGQTVLLAGLISDRQDNSRSGIPLVDQIGEIGRALGKTIKNSQRTELIIFIRPQIIRDSLDATRVAEEMRSRLRNSRVGTSNVPPVAPVAPLTGPVVVDPLRAKN